MVSDSQQWEGTPLPEASFSAPRQSRRSAALMRPNLWLLVVLVLAAALAYVGDGYVAARRLAAAREMAAARAESANADLQDGLARLQDRLDATSHALEETREKLAALAQDGQSRPGQQQRTEIEPRPATVEDAGGSKAGRLAQMQRDLHQSEAERATLAARLSKLETDVGEQRARQTQIKASPDATEKRLQQVSADRDKIASERDRLRTRISQLEKQSQLAPREQPAATSLAPAPAAPVTPTRVADARLPAAATAPPAAVSVPSTATVAAAAPAAASGREGGTVARIEQVLASAGIDVGHLLAEAPRAEGGPFVPASAGQAATGRVSAERIAGLRGLVKFLPLAAPVRGFQVASPFGVRHDPFNGRDSFHTGLDMIAPYMAPVYATAGGTVTFAGYRSDYGNVVEIDHGNGISTRYAHLHRATVTVGQTVAVGTQIGFLGSSGRASGPHLHYEVLVDGEPQDPEKFIGLGHLAGAAR